MGASCGMRSSLGRRRGDQLTTKAVPSNRTPKAVAVSSYGMLHFSAHPRRLCIRAAVSQCESSAGAEASRTFEAFEIRRQFSRRHVSRALSDGARSITFGSGLLLTD